MLNAHILIIYTHALINVNWWGFTISLILIYSVFWTKEKNPDLFVSSTFGAKNTTKRFFSARNADHGEISKSTTSYMIEIKCLHMLTKFDYIQNSYMLLNFLELVRYKRYPSSSFEIENVRSRSSKKAEPLEENGICF